MLNSTFFFLYNINPLHCGLFLWETLVSLVKSILLEIKPVLIFRESDHHGNVRKRLLNFSLPMDASNVQLHVEQFPEINPEN